MNKYNSSYNSSILNASLTLVLFLNKLGAISVIHELPSDVCYILLKSSLQEARLDGNKEGVLNENARLICFYKVAKLVMYPGPAAN